MINSSSIFKHGKTNIEFWYQADYLILLGILGLKRTMNVSLTGWFKIKKTTDQQIDLQLSVKRVELWA